MDRLLEIFSVCVNEKAFSDDKVQRKLARLGLLRPLKELHAVGQIRCTNFRRLFRLACKNGHLGLARWTVGAFAIGEISEDQFWPVRKACKRGRLEILEWLARRFDISAVDPGGLMVAAAENGHLELLRWLVGEFGVTKERLLNAQYWAIKNGHLDAMRYLAENFGLDLEGNEYVLRQGLKSACRQNRLEYAKWLAGLAKENSIWAVRGLLRKFAGLGNVAFLAWFCELAAVTRAEILREDVINAAFEMRARAHPEGPTPVDGARRGIEPATGLSAAKWLLEHFEIDPLILHEEENLLWRVCARGDLAAAQFLIELRQKAGDDPSDYVFMALVEACGSGNLDLVKLLAGLLEPELFGLNLADYFRAACESGSLEVMKWLMAGHEAELAKGNRSRAIEALPRAAESGHLEALAWLVAELGITPEELGAVRADVFRQAVLAGHLHIARWIARLAGLGENEADCVAHEAEEAGLRRVAKQVRRGFVV